MKVFKSLPKALNSIMLAVGLTLMTILVVVAVCLRYLVNRPLLGADELVALVFSVSMFFFMPHCWNEGGHVRIELVFARVSRRWQEAIDIISAAVGTAYLGLIAYQLWQDMMYTLLTGSLTQNLEIPQWPFRTLVSLGVSLFCFVVFASLVSSIHRAFERQKKGAIIAL